VTLHNQVEDGHNSFGIELIEAKFLKEEQEREQAEV
jgi:hypothetical protein